MGGDSNLCMTHDGDRRIQDSCQTSQKVGLPRQIDMKIHRQRPTLQFSWKTTPNDITPPQTACCDHRFKPKDPLRCHRTECVMLAEKVPHIAYLLRGIFRPS